MPPLLKPLRRNQTGQAVGRLHTALLKLGVPIAENEITARRFGRTTLAAIAAFRKQYDLPEVTDTAPPFDASVGRLLHVATAARDGNRAALQVAVRESVAASADALPQESHWLARYAVIAGDYPTAQEAALRAPELNGLVSEITEGVLDPLTHQPQPPEIPFPENFYTYRHTLLPQATIDELLRQLQSVTPEQANGPALGPDAGRGAVLIEVARSWLEAIRQWQFGNSELGPRRYANAVAAYDACQEAALNYFTKYHVIDAGTGTLEQRLSRLIIHLGRNKAQLPHLWERLERRRILLSLQELHDHDFGRPPSLPATALELITNFLHRSEFPLESVLINRQQMLEAPLITIAYVLAPLARGEANRLRRQYAAAVRDLQRVITPFQLGLTIHDPRPLWLTCDFIELPFARLLLAETLLDKGDAEYKARTRVADADLGALEAARTEFKERLTDPGDRNQTAPFQLLQAARTYLSVFEVLGGEGEYVSRVNQGLDTLQTELSESLAQGDVTSNRFRAIGRGIKIPTVQPAAGSLVTLDQRTGPHQPLLRFAPPPEQPVMRESNPRVYSILLQAQARLVQLWSGFNYLGYTDDYVPPWRFQFLLDRGRYFAEHAKNAQRDYLNFLANAEREEFQELSASQNVELEKSNVQIETARVEQVQLEVQAASESAKMAELAAQNAQARLDRYQEFDEYADRLFDTAGLAEEEFALQLAGRIPGLNSAGVFVADFFGGGVGSRTQEKLLAAEQRELEKHNLQLAVKEANQSAVVAAANLEAARAGLIVSGLQRQAALLRHEFALQNLNFLRHRILSAEQWYRLAGTIRSVSETYLRYAIELSFLAEQAYEFEADKSINVIRFDYDQSEIGDFLAADFLLRDLDTLEQDLIVSQRLRQQQVRYVLSMARDFPEALQELRDNGRATLSLPLEQLERRFPGLFNIRIGAVDVLPLALMDPTRFSLELTYLGSSQVRLQGPPDTDDPWSIQFRTRGPETVVFSGLSRQEASAVFPFASTGQRNAFEGLGAASAWQIDMSMRENQVVPDSLADLVITFTLSGYYDADLRAVVDRTPRQALATTTWFSGHQQFPDAFFQFNRTGRMDWQVTPDLLALKGLVGALRNVAAMCIPAQKRPHLGRLMCSYPVEFEVDAAGNMQFGHALPRFSLSTNGLVLSATLSTPTDASVTFDFGDGTGLVDSAALPHTYTRPGRYDVLVRIAANGRLTEYRAAVVVSRQHTVLPPCIAVPALQTTVVGNKIKLEPALQSPSGETLSVIWRIDNEQPDVDSDPVTFTLDPGRYVLRFLAVRPLTARFYSQQRFDPTSTLEVTRLHLATNRTFDLETGAETTTNPNGFSQHVFRSDILAPADRWTLELPMDDNTSVVSVSSTDVKQPDLSELSDAVLALEYEVRDA